MSGHLNHDTAARLLDLTPAELSRLVDRGVIPRVDKNAYNLAPLVHAYVRHLRDEAGRIERAPTQAEIAAHLDISDRRLRELLAEFGLDHKQTPLAEIRIRYLRKLREEAAGRSSGVAGGLDLVQERAALAREQREAVAIKNAVARREYAPVELLTQVLSDACSAVVERLEALPARLRKEVPALPIEAHEAIGAVIASARNEWVRAASEAMLRQAPVDIADDGDELEESPA